MILGCTNRIALSVEHRRQSFVFIWHYEYSVKIIKMWANCRFVLTGKVGQ